MGNFCNILATNWMVATYKNKLLCEERTGRPFVRVVTHDAADDIIANNTPISEWQDGESITWSSVESLKNEDGSTIDATTQTMLIEDAPDIDDWAIDVELAFIIAQ